MTTCPPPPFLQRAGRWFLHSGIQEPEGGVARYHYISDARNARISTEITGYTVSALLELHDRTGDAAYLQAASRAGDLLCAAWDAKALAMPFEWSATGELPEHHSYFFDNGIIIRGLVRLWKATSNQRYLDIAVLCGESMSRDFVNKEDIHPILILPGKQPLPRDPRWSRSSDCYQLKSALGWLDLAAATGRRQFEADFETALERGLRTHAQFLANEPDRQRRMDRLHAYSYFLEALLARIERPAVRAALAEGIDRTSFELRSIRGDFERSDVNGQLLRVRLWADAAGAVPLNEAEAAEEAASAASYQIISADGRHDGGFNFGRRNGALSNFCNPVSTAFVIQALALWDDRSHGKALGDWHKLI
ncbi:MAG: hypothetical protein HY821_04260 [Acidobacteria bacterium]|nr:hypothetical protein [Acidobacteriota bacterium]